LRYTVAPYVTDHCYRRDSFFLYAGGKTPRSAAEIAVQDFRVTPGRQLTVKNLPSPAAAGTGRQRAKKGNAGAAGSGGAIYNEGVATLNLVKTATSTGNKCGRKRWRWRRSTDGDGGGGATAAAPVAERFHRRRACCDELRYFPANTRAAGIDGNGAGRVASAMGGGGGIGAPVAAPAVEAIQHGRRKEWSVDGTSPATGHAAPKRPRRVGNASARWREWRFRQPALSVEFQREWTVTSCPHFMTTAQAGQPVRRADKSGTDRDDGRGEHPVAGLVAAHLQRRRPHWRDEFTADAKFSVGAGQAGKRRRGGAGGSGARW